MNPKISLYLFLTSIIQLLYYLLHVGNNFDIVSVLLGFQGGFLMIFSDSYLTRFVRFYFISDDG